MNHNFYVGKLGSGGCSLLCHMDNALIEFINRLEELKKPHTPNYSNVKGQWKISSK